MKNKDWRVLTFDEAVADLSSGNVKTPQSEYKTAGHFAVVDQGKALVAGYIDDEERLCRATLPVVIFGDHTRCLKFVDFPFGMGADGIKVLKPKEASIDEKYLFHFLRQLRLPDGGYGRHFKYLKRERIPLPPLPEQRRIAAILDQAETLRSQRRAAIAQLDSLGQAVFLEMFGDPATNPKGWRIGKIGDLLSSASYGTSQKAGAAGEFPVLRMGNVTSSGEIDLGSLKYMDLAPGDHDRYLVRAGDVLFNRTNSAELVGKTAVFRDTRPIAYAGYLVRLRMNSENDSEYLGRFLNTAYAKATLRGMAKSIVGMANINAKEVQAMRIALPPLVLQQTFAHRIQSIERLKATHRAALARLDELFASLQHRAFCGEL